MTFILEFHRPKSFMIGVAAEGLIISLVVVSLAMSSHSMDTIIMGCLNQVLRKIRAEEVPE